MVAVVCMVCNIYQHMNAHFCQNLQSVRANFDIITKPGSLSLSPGWTAWLCQYIQIMISEDEGWWGVVGRGSGVGHGGV